MNKPRCGNPDVQQAPRKGARSGRIFWAKNWAINSQAGAYGKWHKNNLTYKVVEYAEKMSNSEVG